MAINVTKPSVNLREKLNELETNKGLKGNEILQAETAQEVRSLIGAGRKNLIINGDFKVSQRGDYTSATTTTSGYDLDRWVTSVAGVTATLQQVVTPSLPAGESEYSDSVKVSATSTATGSIGVVQKLEDDTVLGGRTFTLSAWIKSNHAKAYLYLYEGNDGVYHYSSTHSGGGDWEKITVTGTLATGSTDVRVYAKIQSGSDSNTSIISGDYIEISQVQLELGSVATDFEHRSYGEELALCQRYYWTESQSDSYHNVCTGFYPNTTLFIGVVHTPVAMRLSPSLITSGNWETAGNGSSTVSAFLLTDSTGSDLTCFQIRATVSNVTTGQGASLRNATDTTAIIALDAEL